MNNPLVSVFKFTGYLVRVDVRNFRNKDYSIDTERVAEAVIKCIEEDTGVCGVWEAKFVSGSIWNVVQKEDYAHPSWKAGNYEHVI